MQSPNDKLKKLVFWIVLSTIIYVTENMLPRPMPWLKIGLANIVFLLLLKKNIFELRTLFLILFFRNLIGAYHSGALLPPVFLTGLIAGAASIISMFIMLKIFGNRISLIGMSITGALVNMAMQICAGSLLVYQNFTLFNLLPYFLMYAYFAGIVTGIFANKLYKP